ncbi:hypothetical protein PR202_ga19191 [Eleusine coracana subsp. coracana]|uniref:Uncharacterized protein n=1 Tax=Eleusine coracana subsp. coracana TaxID=191504 RepID=A0AAV5CTD1_ELECO|nr:hypothetical protein QOZ80_4AG0305720 [Eleusine coracana subsp. coracana]GJN01889.1 hypothetical protein PR202_ga19191 [Eleusine coracana subsp. coracana]
MGKKAGIMQEKGEPSAPAARKRKRGGRRSGDASGKGICDDVIRSIFARLPARAAVASMVLSKDHRRMICSPEFRSLHCRLAPPLPPPHIAYVATAPIRRRSDRDPVSGYHGFHVAGPGITGNGGPMRALSGWKYLNMKFSKHPYHGEET